MWLRFKQNLWKFIAEDVPLITIRQQKYKRYVPKHIKHLIYQKKKVWKLYKLTKNLQLKNLFKRHCNDCKSAIKNFNRQELEQLCKSTNTKPFFSFTIKKIGRQKQKIEIKDL